MEVFVAVSGKLMLLYSDCDRVLRNLIQFYRKDQQNFSMPRAVFLLAPTLAVPLMLYSVCIN
jgi:hypothetical protein